MHARAHAHCCSPSRSRPRRARRPASPGGKKDSWAIDYQATRNVLDAARKAGAKHFVLLSAICVQKPLLEFQKAKLQFESELAAAGDITYSIVRPTAFFKSLAGQVRSWRRGSGGARACCLRRLWTSGGRQAPRASRGRAQAARTCPSLQLGRAPTLMWSAPAPPPQNRSSWCRRASRM